MRLADVDKMRLTAVGAHADAGEEGCLQRSVTLVQSCLQQNLADDIQRENATASMALQLQENPWKHPYH